MWKGLIGLLLLATAAVYGFSYSNCGEPSDGVQVTQLSVTPSPVVLGQNVTVYGSVSLNETLMADSNDISVVLELYHEVFGVWVYIPCVDNVGSCSYTDLCAKLDANTNPCPSVLEQYGIPCKCPFNAGSFKIPAPGVSIATKKTDVSLLDGNFKAQATVTDKDGHRLLCIYVEASISTSLDGETRHITFQ